MSGLELPPGADELPEDLLKMVLDAVIENQRHLQRMDEREMTLAERGQTFAFATTVLFGGLATWVTLAGHGEVGAVIASTTIAAVAAAFIVGRRRSEGRP